MLIRNFYSIEDLKITENRIEAQISLNPEHEVYKGHFPNQAVVPGVIQLQIIKELMEKVRKQKLLLSKMAFAKYLKMIVPGASPKLAIHIEHSENEDNLRFSSLIKDEQNTFTKVNGTFTVTRKFTKSV